MHVISGACNHLIGILCGRATAFCSSRTLSALDCTAHDGNRERHMAPATGDDFVFRSPRLTER
jgi:hypothetical protein